MRNVNEVSFDDSSVKPPTAGSRIEESSVVKHVFVVFDRATHNA